MKAVAGTHAKLANAPFRPDIEGLRGIAVVLVVLYHAGTPGIRGGFIGVDVFFALSGYLITGLLVIEARRTGRIDLVRFYTRRARRLLPAAALVVLATVLVGAVVLSPFEQQRFTLTAIATELYASNIHFASFAGDYFATALETNPFLHTWSLAVEEQFYLFWPLLILISLRSGRPERRLRIVMSLVCLVSLAVCVRLTYSNASWAFFGSPVRAWEFGLGGLAAGIPATFLQTWPRLCRVISWTGLAAILAAALSYSAHTNFPGIAAAVPVVGTIGVLVAGAAWPGRGVGGLLDTPILQWLGKHSYSWYLWHWPTIVLASALVPNLNLPTRLLLILLSLGIAALAYRFVENPIRYHPALKLPLPTLALVALLTFGVTGTAFASHRLAQNQSAKPIQKHYAAAMKDHTATLDCLASSADESSLASCGVEEEGRRRPTVAVYGDSHASQWLPAVAEVARLHGWRTVAITKAACPSIDVVIDNPRQGADYNQECTDWRRKSLKALSTLRPDLVLVSNSQEHVAGERRRDHRKRVSPAEWGLGSLRTLSYLDSVGIRVLLLRDTPRLGRDVPVCLSRRTQHAIYSNPHSCESPRELALDDRVFQAERSATLNLRHVRIADLTDRFCDPHTCVPEQNGMVVFSDFDHITGRFAASLAPALDALIVDMILDSGGTRDPLSPTERVVQRASAN